MILGLLALVAANLGVSLGAWALLRKLRTERPVLDAALFLLLRLLLISAAVLAAGLARALDPVFLGAAGAAAAAAIWARCRPALRPPPLPTLGIGIGLLLAFVLLRLAAQVWIFSPYVGDTLAYHLPKVAAWVQAGALTLELGPDPRSWFPAGFELVETWWTLFLHHDVLIELAGVEFLALGSLAAAALAEGLGFGARERLWAGLLYGLTPGLHLGATSCLNDAPAAAVVVTLFALVQAGARWELALAAAALGIGIKPTVGFALPGVLLLAVWRRPSLQGGAAPRILLALALLVGGFWYARNAWAHGNPLHPVTSSGYAENGVLQQRSGPSAEALGRNARAAANSRIYDTGVYGATLDAMSGWGVACFALGLPGLLAFVRRGGDERRLALAFLLSLLSVFACVQPDPWNMRFTLFFPAVLAVAATAFAREAPALRIARAAAAGVLLLGTTLPAEFPIGGIGDAWASSWRERTRTSVPGDALRHDGTAVTRGAKRTYSLYRPDFSGRVVTIEAERAEDLLSRMAERGLRRVHGWSSHPAIREALETGRLAREPGAFFRRTD